MLAMSPNTEADARTGPACIMHVDQIGFIAFAAQSRPDEILSPMTLRIYLRGSVEFLLEVVLLLCHSTSLLAVEPSAIYCQGAECSKHEKQKVNDPLSRAPLVRTLRTQPSTCALVEFPARMNSWLIAFPPCLRHAGAQATSLLCLSEGGHQVGRQHLVAPTAFLLSIFGHSSSSH